MVIRLWRAKVQPGKEGEFERMLREQWVPALRAQPGCTGITLGKATKPEGMEFAVVTTWKDLEALQKLTGPAFQRSIVNLEEIPLLQGTELEHYVTLLDA